MQKVYLGRTQSGHFGLFTNGVLAKSLTANQYAHFSANEDAAASYCKKLRFEYVPTIDAPASREGKIGGPL